MRKWILKVSKLQVINGKSGLEFEVLKGITQVLSIIK